MIQKLMRNSAAAAGFAALLLVGACASNDGLNDTADTTDQVIQVQPEAASTVEVTGNMDPSPIVPDSTDATTVDTTASLNTGVDTTVDTTASLSTTPSVSTTTTTVETTTVPMTSSVQESTTSTTTLTTDDDDDDETPARTRMRKD
jgi:hypothetical protein